MTSTALDAQFRLNALLVGSLVIALTLPPQRAAVAQLDPATARWIRALNGLVEVELDEDEQWIVELNLDRTREIDPGFSPDLLNENHLAQLARMTRLRRLTLKRRSISDEYLRHLRQVASLEELNLDRTGINGSGLVHLSNLEHLRSLTLRECQQIDDDSMRFLTELQQLRELSLTGDTNVGQDDVGWASEVAWRGDVPATHIYDEYCGGITDVGLAQLCEMPRLESLCVAKTHITDVGLTHLPQLAGLRRLDLSRTAITDAGLEELARLKKLESLSLGFTLVTDEGLQQLSALRNLHHLVVAGTAVSNAGLAHIAQLPELKVLDLSYCLITDEGLEQLRALDSLERVILFRTQVTLHGLRRLIDAHPNTDLGLMLRDTSWAGDESDDRGPVDYLGEALLDRLLDVPPPERELTWIWYHGEALMAGDLDFLNQFPSLTGLFLSRSTVADDELVYLEPLTELRELNLSRTGVTDGGLVHLEPLTELTTLNIDGTAITFGGLRELFQAQSRPMIDLFRVPRYLQPTNYLQPDSLLRLDLRRTGLTDADLAAISKFPPAMQVFVDGSGEASAARVIQAIQFDPLEVLWLHAISFNRESLTSLATARDLKMLWLTNASLEDSDLEVLERFPALEVLNLCGSPLTDSAIESLKELKSLRILVVDNTAFSESALQLLRASLPQLTVYPSQQHAIRAIRGRDRTIARLINAPSNIDETSPVRTEINGPDELLNIFGDAYFEEAESIDRASEIPAAALHQMQYLSTLERVSFVNAADARRFLMEVRHAPVRRISLYRSKVDDDDLELIAGMDSLEELDLQRTDVTDACLATLASLPNLHVLKMGDGSAAVGDAGMSQLRELPLEELDLSRTGITAVTLRHIGSIPTLRRLSLREVNVGNGLQHLQQLESLERLDLYHAEIDEGSWQPLLSLTALRRLDLNGTTIPLEAVIELRSALPECDVSFSEPSN